jgi:hypothetical protein
MHTKKFVITGVCAFLALVFILAGAYMLPPRGEERLTSERGDRIETEHTDDVQDNVSTDRRALPPEELPVTIGKIKADMFTGTLEVVDTGCFADGECYVEVNGKHVTAIMGWSQETVGTIKGVDSFGDLEKYIGKQVEVYAQVREDGTYTLYGSEGFYIKLLESDSAGGAPQTPLVAGGCSVGGCSGQVCGEASALDGLVTTCEYRAEYACYKEAVCERQATGMCGWTETPALRACLRGGGEQAL